MKKALKIAISAAMLGCVTAAFFGAPTYLACRIQPSATITFLVVLLLTPLVGRLFCECLCPLGIIQTAVNWLFHPKTHVRRVCTRLPETKAQQIVRWTVLALVLVLALTGFGAVAWFVTPYSIYGKALTLFWPGVGLFALVAVLAALGKGRIWCNWVCPVGTLFNLLSKKSVCVHKVGKGCGNCRACFAQKKKEEEPVPFVDGGVTRRDALKGVAVFAAVKAAEKTTDGGFADVSLPGVPARPVPALPPGAVDRSDFNLKCVACGLCIANCRGGCLSVSTSLKRFGQPEMDFRHGYCLTGCAQQCAKVCPAGAIRPLDGVERKNVHVGHAIWKRELCIRETEGVQCTACSRKCPVGAIHVVEGFPVVDKGKCIGCGACEHVCPARPMPAIFVKGFERQRIVRPMDEAGLLAEMKALIDGGASCVAARDGVIVGKETGFGVKSLLKLLDEGKLAHTFVVAKVVGRAAAAICVVGKVKRVYASIMGADAAALLKAHGIESGADKTVPKILNHNLTASCPMEQAVEGFDNPVAIVKELKEKAK